MKRIISYKLFESTTEDNNDKYILNLSSANSMIGAEAWISNSPRITDSIKASAEKVWTILTNFQNLSSRVEQNILKFFPLKFCSFRPMYVFQ